MKKVFLLSIALLSLTFTITAQDCKFSKLFSGGQKSVYPLDGDTKLVRQTIPVQVVGPYTKSNHIDRFLCSFVKAEGKSYLYTLQWLNIPPATFTTNTKLILTLADNSKIELVANSEKSIVQLKKAMPNAPGQMQRNESGLQIGYTYTNAGTVYYSISIPQIKKLVEFAIVNIDIEVLTTEKNEIFVCSKLNVNKKKAAEIQEDAACILTILTD